MKVAIYARVSTKDQSAEMQLRELRNYVKARDFIVFKEYIDHGISGTKEKRPALNQLMFDARKKKFDVVLVYRFDRFARSTKHLIDALNEFNHLKIDFISYNENIDTSSPLGKAMFTIVSAIGQLERDIIAQRVKSGLANARANGKMIGRPPKDRVKIIELRKNGFSIRQIAKSLGISKGAVQNAISLLNKY